MPSLNFLVSRPRKHKAIKRGLLFSHFKAGSFGKFYSVPESRRTRRNGAKASTDKSPLCSTIWHIRGQKPTAGVKGHLRLRTPTVARKRCYRKQPVRRPVLMYTFWRIHKLINSTNIFLNLATLCNNAENIFPLNRSRNIIDAWFHYKKLCFVVSHKGLPFAGKIKAVGIALQ